MPAGHLQTVLLEGVQADTVYIPPEQVEHAVQVAALAEVEKVLPVTQAAGRSDVSGGVMGLKTRKHTCTGDVRGGCACRGHILARVAHAACGAVGSSSCAVGVVGASLAWVGCAGVADSLCACAGQKRIIWVQGAGGIDVSLVLGLVGDVEDAYEGASCAVSIILACAILGSCAIVRE